MNSCILMAQIVSDPELRSTQDQTNVSTMMVEFESTREGEAPNKVQVESWGNLAEEVKNKYRAGDRIVIEGRLSMNLFEMPEGYKEKRAKLVASRVYSMGGSNTSPANFAPSTPSNVVDFASTPQPQDAPVASPTAVTPEPTAPASNGDEDWDKIPF